MSIAALALYALIAAAVVAGLALLSYGVVAVAMVVLAMFGARLPGPVRLGRFWLRLLTLHHVFSASCWAGAALAMIVLTTVAPGAPGVTDSPGARQTLAMVLVHIDRWVIIPTAMSTVASGLLLSFLGGWTLRFSWVLAKAVAGLWATGVGWLLVTPRIQALAAQAGLDPAASPAAGLFAPGFYVLGAIQFCLILSMLALSIFKPWDRDGVIER